MVVYAGKHRHFNLCGVAPCFSLKNSLSQVSAVSPKRHTTRENTLGVMTVGNAQVFFHDTPGFVSHEERDDYQPALAAASREAIGLVNVTLLVVDASKEVTKRGFRSLVALLERSLLSRCEIFLVLNKTDAVNPKHRLLSTTDTIMDKAQEIMDRLDKEREEASAGRSSSGDEAGPGGGAEGISLFRDGGKTVDDHITVFMVSAKTGDGVEDIVDFLVHRSRPGSWLFGRDDTTNKDKRTRVTEIVREGLFKHLYKELPYQMKTETRYVTSWCLTLFAVQSSPQFVHCTTVMRRKSRLPCPPRVRSSNPSKMYCL